MRKKDLEETVLEDDIRDEYDFSAGERHVAYRSLDRGYTIREERADGTVLETQVPPRGEVIILDGDVRKYFPDSDSVNRALRSIIALFPKPLEEPAHKQGSQPRRRRAAGSKEGRS
jgi:hypothetical protein